MKNFCCVLCVLTFIGIALPESVFAMPAPLSEKAVQIDVQQSIEADTNDPGQDEQPASGDNLQSDTLIHLAALPEPPVSESGSPEPLESPSETPANPPEVNPPDPALPGGLIPDSTEETEPVNFLANENEEEEMAPQEADNPVNPAAPQVTPETNPVSITYSTNDDTGTPVLQQARLTGTTFSPACSGAAASLVPSGSSTCSVTLRTTGANGVPVETKIRLFIFTLPSAALNAMRTDQLLGRPRNIEFYTSQNPPVIAPLPGISSLTSVLGRVDPQGFPPKFSGYSNDTTLLSSGYIRLSMPGSAGTAQNVSSLRFVFDPANPNRLTKLEFVDTTTAAGNVLFSANAGDPSDTVPGVQEVLARQNAGETAAAAAERALEDQIDDQGNAILGLRSLADQAEAKRDAARILWEENQNSRSQTQQTPDQIQASINTRNEKTAQAEAAARDARAFAGQVRRDADALSDAVAGAVALQPNYRTRIQAAYDQAQAEARRAETAASDAEYNAQQARIWADSINRYEVLQSVNPALINMAGSAAVIPGNRDIAVQAQNQAQTAFDNLRAANNALDETPPRYADIPAASAQLQAVRTAARSASDAAADAARRFDARNAEVQPLLNLIDRLDPNARDTDLQAARTNLIAQLENIRRPNQAAQESKAAVDALLLGAERFFNRLEAVRPPIPALAVPPPNAPEPIVPNPPAPLHEMTQQIPWSVRFQLLGGEQNITNMATPLTLRYTTTKPSFWSTLFGRSTPISNTNVNVNRTLSSPNYRFFPVADGNALLAAGFRPDQLEEVTVDGQTYIRIRTSGNSSYLLDAAGNLSGVVENNTLRFVSGGNQGTVAGFMVNNQLIRTNDGSGSFDYSTPGQVYWVRNFTNYNAYTQALNDSRPGLDVGSSNNDLPPITGNSTIRYRVI